jgi:hypothetical protein
MKIYQKYTKEILQAYVNQAKLNCLFETKDKCNLCEVYESQIASFEQRLAECWEGDKQFYTRKINKLKHRIETLDAMTAGEMFNYDNGQISMKYALLNMLGESYYQSDINVLF